MISRTSRVTFFTILLFLLAFCSGCNNEAKRDANIAYISINENSQYKKTFKELNLGILYDFNLRLTEADTSWVTLWVEGYKHGEPTEPFRLIELSYGPSLQKVTEGPLGFGIINSPAEEDPLFFLYSSGAFSPPRTIGNIFDTETARAIAWDFAIGDKELGLQSGEIKVLGVTREVDKIIKTYDYQDTDQINQIIEEDLTVLLLKIKVERQ